MMTRIIAYSLTSLTLLLTGCDGKLGRPDLLWLLWASPLLIAFYIYVARTKAALLKQFASLELVARLAGNYSQERQTYKAACIVIALTLGVLSLAQPRYGFTWEDVKREGVDIVIALDVSDSMLVEDAESGGKLTRIERAKREITDLLQLLDGDRVGLVAFAGTSFLECPLTLDYAAAQIFLGTIDTDLIPVKGTDLSSAILTSVDAFKGGNEGSRAIILITDGEDHSGQALAAAEEAKKENVRVFTIGIGRDEGAPIPDPRGGFRKDRRGEMILSKLDEPTLQKIALNTGGRYVRSVTGDMDLEEIYIGGIKATMQDQELGSKRRQHWEERFQWVLALMLLFLMIEPFISEQVRRGDKHVA